MRTEKGKRLEAAFREGIEAAKDETAVTTTVEVPTIDVKAIRDSLNLTQEDFAERFGFSVASVRNWEQERRRPEKSARLLLAMIEQAPEMVRDVLEQISSPNDQPRPRL